MHRPVPLRSPHALRLDAPDGSVGFCDFRPVPESFRDSLAPKRLQTQREEVRQRADLLLRLGRNAKAAEARIRGNLAWEYELSKRAAPVHKEVAGIVKEAWERR